MLFSFMCALHMGSPNQGPLCLFQPRVAPAPRILRVLRPMSPTVGAEPVALGPLSISENLSHVSSGSSCVPRPYYAGHTCMTQCVPSYSYPWASQPHERATFALSLSCSLAVISAFTCRMFSILLSMHTIIVPLQIAVEELCFQSAVAFETSTIWKVEPAWTPLPGGQ